MSLDPFFTAVAKRYKLVVSVHDGLEDLGPHPKLSPGRYTVEPTFSF